MFKPNTRANLAALLGLTAIFAALLITLLGFFFEKSSTHSTEKFDLISITVLMFFLWLLLLRILVVGASWKIVQDNLVHVGFWGGEKKISFSSIKRFGLSNGLVIEFENDKGRLIALTIPTSMYDHVGELITRLEEAIRD